MFIQSCSRMRQCNTDHGLSNRDTALCTLPHPLICIHWCRSPQDFLHFRLMMIIFSAVVWMLVCPQNSHIGILMPNMMVLGNGASEWWLHHEDIALISEINVSRGPRKFPCLFCHVGTVGSLPSATQKKAFTRRGPGCTLILYFQPPELQEIISVVYKPRCLWSFVIVAWLD